MSGDREIGRELRDLRAPGEAAAEERSWAVVRAAYADRAPAASARRIRRPILAAAVVVGLIVVGLSPAGARVVDLVRDVVGVGEENARPQLRALPAAGELLVESAQGPWIVHDDGSKRLLGDYGDATWSPHGLFVTATDGRELVTVDPVGDVRWTTPPVGRARDPRWSPGDLAVGFWVAYRSGPDLRVVDGTGARDHLVARDVAPVAPAWRPVGASTKVAAARGIPTHALSYVDADQKVHAVDVDTGDALRTTPADRERLSTSPSGAAVRRALSPDGSRLATLDPARGATKPMPGDPLTGLDAPATKLVLQRAGAGGKRILFRAPGVLTGPTWSPDGRWLLVGWPEADQWLFIRADRPHRVVAFDRITEQFDPGGAGDAGRDGGAGDAPFPRVAGWVLPER